MPKSIQRIDWAALGANLGRGCFPSSRYLVAMSMHGGPARLHKSMRPAHTVGWKAWPEWYGIVGRRTWAPFCSGSESAW
jgi:hypothetical protein